MNIFILLLLSIITTGALAVGMDSDRAVDAHNENRNLLNKGILGTQPTPDPYIPNVSWDQPTADNAQRHTDRCVFEHSDDRAGAGENIAAGYGSIERAVDGWVSEHTGYTYPDGFSSGTGHYTQVMWSSSVKIGCGETYCSPIKKSDGSTLWSGDLISCQYQPPGNYSGRLPYSVDGSMTGTVPTYSWDTEEVLVPFVDLDGVYYRAKLQQVTDEAPYLFTITVLKEDETGNGGGYGTAFYTSNNNELYLPIVRIDNTDYEVGMRHRGGGILELIYIK
jgi:hypothetical protein